MSVFNTIALAPSPLALKQAGDLWPQVEATIREDLEKELGERTDFILHTVMTAESGDYLCWPDEDGACIYIDAVFWEEGPTLTEGPLKGKQFSMPRPASLRDTKSDQ